MADQQVARPDPIATLEKSLQEKESVILALTTQLEDVAEQLDRFQRTGGDRSGRAAAADGGGSQQALLTDLSRVVETWKEQQPGERLQRLETRLDEIHHLLRQAVSDGSAPAVLARKSAEASPPPEKTRTESRSSEPAKSEPAKSGGGEKDRRADSLSAWEAMKAQLMADGDKAAAAKASNKSAATSKKSTEPAAPTPAAPLAAEPTVIPPKQPAPVLDHTPIVEPEAPQPIAVDIATRGELVQAIEAREEYIHFLVRRLRNVDQKSTQLPDWEALQHVPEDLRRHLQSLASELEARLRISEVDLSLERARLSRIQANIEITQRKIEQHVKQQVGRKRLEETEGTAPDDARSWFGRKKK